jgi:hypothetical protein
MELHGRGEEARWAVRGGKMELHTVKEKVGVPIE